MRFGSLLFWTKFVVGLVGGIMLCSIYQQKDGIACHFALDRKGLDLNFQPTIRSAKRSNVYLGVMSAGKYIKTRVQRNVETWLKKGKWKIEVFADGDKSSLKVPPGLDINIVKLPTVDDTAYPPQKKSFLLLRHMYDQHINDFDWFLRVDDDSYTDYPRLERLLNKMNSSLPIYFGNPGFGKDSDDVIEIGMPYLMGGLGMIFSRGMLIQLRPHLKHCIQHLFSPHEDIEIGRCVWKHTKSITPTAWETMEIFYQQYQEEIGSVDIKIEQLTPKKMRKAITYHSAKADGLMHRLHNKIMRRNLYELTNRTSRLQNEISHMRNMIDLYSRSIKNPQKDTDLLVTNLEKKNSLGGEEVDPWSDSKTWDPTTMKIFHPSAEIPWIHFDKSRRYDVKGSIPLRGHSNAEHGAINKIIADIQTAVIPSSCPGFPSSKVFQYGYMQHDVMYGVNLAAIFKSSSGTSVKLCRTFSRIPFGVTLVGEEEDLLSDDGVLKMSMMSEVGVFRHGVKGLLGVVEGGEDETGEGLPKFGPIVREPFPSSPLSTFSSAGHRLIFVIPLQGRYRALEQFMKRYEEDFLKPSVSPDNSEFDIGLNVQLAVVIMGGDDRTDDSGINRASAQLLKSYQSKYGSNMVRYHVETNGDRSFSRGAGLQLGSLIGGEHDILFFVDIDMVVTQNVVAQCRRNIRKGQVVWYPVTYSQYDPDKLCYRSEDISDSKQKVFAGGVGNENSEDEPEQRRYVRESIRQTPLTLNKDRGFWRDFGFGIACMYKSDFIKTGGFDLSIEGWGEEDIRLLEALVKTKLQILRSRQHDLVHIFHPKHCSPDMPSDQKRACEQTKASHFASQSCLSKTWTEKFSK